MLILDGIRYHLHRYKNELELEEFAIEGINTTIPFHLQVLQDERFLSGNFDTSFLEKFEFTE